MKYKIRVTDKNGNYEITVISKKTDLKKFPTSHVECLIGSNMPVSLHNAIAEHNSKIQL